MYRKDQLKRRKSLVREIVEWSVSLGIAVLVAFLIHSYAFTPELVHGKSMMPTLQDQNKMFVNKLEYRFAEPDRFDIIVFHATAEEDYIKRVIGLPGESLEYRNDILYIDGKAVEEPYLDEYKAELTGENLTEDFTLETATGVTKIPEGKYFVMGDNRRNSKDSRMIGLVDEEQIVGSANLVYSPLSDLHFVN